MNKIFSLIAIQFYLLALAGMLAHAIKKWFQSEIDGHVLRWYLDNPKYTTGVLFTVAGATITGVATGLYTDANDPIQIVACFTVAFGIDSFNKQ